MSDVFSSSPPRSEDVPTMLEGRMLLQVGPQRVGYVREHVDAEHSGLVLSGATALQEARQLRRTGFSGPLLADPAAYTRVAASGRTPFPELEDEAQEGWLPFGDDPVEQVLEAQLQCGASAALTPTGYVHAQDWAALEAVVVRGRELAGGQVVLALPLDVEWLRAPVVGQLVSWLREVPGGKALMLGGQRDPLAHFPEAVRSLQKLLRGVPGIALLRSDLAAFGALAYGAAFSAFGVSSSVRHIVPPPQPAKRRGGPPSPPVLFPELMDFFLGGVLAQRFAAMPAPVCRCAACGERGLDTFVSNRFQVSAAAHSAAVLMEWVRRLQVLEAGGARRRWWHEQCRQAVARYPVLNAELDQPGAFTVPVQLSCWTTIPGPAAAPVPPSSTQQ